MQRPSWDGRTTVRSVVIAYGLSLAAVAVAVLVRLPLYPLLGDRIPFMTLFPAIAFVAWYCGRGPALFALVVSSLAVACFILEPRYSFAIGQIEYQAGLVLYIITRRDDLRLAWRDASPSGQGSAPWARPSS